MMKYSFFLFLFFSLIFASAQTAGDQRRYIEVTGTSEAEISPDELYVTITLMERMDGKDKVGIDKQENDLKKSIKDIGLEVAALTLNAAQADYQTVRKKNKDVLISRNYTLKMSNTEQLTKLYEKLDQINAHDAYVSRYSHSKILDLQKENRIKAMKAGKDKADYLLGAIGQQAGMPIQVTESENYVQDGGGEMSPRGIASNARMMLDRVVGGAEAEHIGFKKIKIRSSYIIRFEISSK